MRRIINKTTAISRGFTLMEIMVSIVIVGILAVLAIPRFTLSAERARTGEALQTLATVLDGMKIYEFENGSYPGDLGELNVTLPASLSNYDFENAGGGTILNPACADAVTCARVKRNHIYDYTVAIELDGDIICVDGTTAGICHRLGL